MQPTEDFQATATAAETEKLERLADSFLTETASIGDFQIRKPSIAGLRILARARNKFACGFSADDLRRIFPNGDPETAKANRLPFLVAESEILQHLHDLFQLVRLCQATPDELRTWYFDPKAFDDAVFDFANAAECNSADLGRLFGDAFLVIGEIQDAEVEAAKPTGPKKPQKKKEPRARRSSSPTSAPSRKPST